MRLKRAVWPLLLAVPLYVGINAEDALAKDVRPSAHLASRELKKDKNYENSSIYSRARELIWGSDKNADLYSRPRMAVLINGDEDLVADDRVKDQIYSQLRQKFPRAFFALIKGTDINTKLLQYAEEIYYDQREAAVSGSVYNGDRTQSFLGFGAARHEVTESVGGRQAKVDVDGMPVGNRPRGLSDMRREDYVRAGRECGYDYVFVATLNAGHSKTDVHHYLIAGSKSKRQNVWLRIRLIDVNNGNYLYRNDIVATGLAHNGYMKGRPLARSVANAMQEAMNDIDIDDGIRR